MQPSNFARTQHGDRAARKVARCLAIYWLKQAGALPETGLIMPRTKCALAERFGVSRLTIDSDLAAIEAAVALVEEMSIST